MISTREIEDIDNLLYGRLCGRKPIRSAMFGRQVTWYPKANEGQKWTDEDATDADRYGVWGGTVEGYGRGFQAQPCWLHFIGIDVDHKKAENATWTPTDLHDTVYRLAKDTGCTLRTSSSGAGYHLFFLLKEPVEFPNKRSAQEAAGSLARSLILPKFAEARVDVDKAACNQLWVLGGKQKTLWIGPANVVDLSKFKSSPETTVSPVGESDISGVSGPCAQEFLRLLATTGANRSLTHLTLIKRAVAGTEYEGVFAPYESGDNVDEPNTSITVVDGKLRVFSFRYNKALHTIPVWM